MQYIEENVEDIGDMVKRGKWFDWRGQNLGDKKNI